MVCLGDRLDAGDMMYIGGIFTAGILYLATLVCISVKAVERMIHLGYKWLIVFFACERSIFPGFGPDMMFQWMVLIYINVALAK